MTKRSRKIASGKANVVRRSSLNTTSVYTHDPLSLDSSALRRNVRTSLMFGTALGASLLTAVIIDGQPAMAGSCTNANPSLCTGDFSCWFVFNSGTVPDTTADLTMVLGDNTSGGAAGTPGTIENAGGDGFIVAAGGAGLTFTVITNSNSSIGVSWPSHKAMAFVFPPIGTIRLSTSIRMRRLALRYAGRGQRYQCEYRCWWLFRRYQWHCYWHK